MDSHRIRSAVKNDAREIAAMMAELWPEGLVEEFRQEAELLIGCEACGTLPATILVAEGGDGSLTGFLQAGLRSHADGCDVEHPVGYIEGWFVIEPMRGRGVGRALAAAAEEWARAHGCHEMASDALMSNARSQQAHSALGYEVVDRCVHYRKPL